MRGWPGLNERLAEYGICSYHGVRIDDSGACYACDRERREQSANTIEELQQTIRDLKKQLREVEADRDHYKALCESLKDAPKPEYG